MISEKAHRHVREFEILLKVAAQSVILLEQHAQYHMNQC